MLKASHRAGENQPTPLANPRRRQGDCQPGNLRWLFKSALQPSHWFSLFLVVAILISTLAIACAPSISRKVPNIAETLAQGNVENPYHLQVGDLIGIKFYHNPELDQEVVIRPDGMISLPLLDEIRAAGLTPAVLDAKLTRGFTGELARPEITIIVRNFGGQRVYVGGEVGQQGVIPLSGGLTLFQAVQEAGGFLPTAHRKQVILIRRGPDGKPVGQSIDVRPVQSGEHPEEDIPLRPYDVVFVPRSKIANVNVFVEQYIVNVLPITPGIYFTSF